MDWFKGKKIQETIGPLNPSIDIIIVAYTSHVPLD